MASSASSPRCSVMAGLMLALGSFFFASQVALAAPVPLWAQHVARRLAQAPNTAGIPPECVQTGLNLQTACNAEIQAASKAFGIAVPNNPNALAAGTSLPPISQEKFNAYLANGPPVSKGCCTAFCNFNNNYCLCNPAVVNLVKSFVNNDLSQANAVAQFTASRCNFPLINQGTCPADASKAKKPAGQCPS